MDHVGYKSIKNILISAICIISSMLCACQISDFPQKIPVKNVYTEGIDLGDKIMEAIQKGSCADLEELFCTYCREQTDLETQLQNAFDFFEGKITGFDKPDADQGKRSTDSKGVIYDCIKGNVLNIETDEGKKYELKFFSYRENRDHPEYIGVYCIWITDVDCQEKITVGEVI